MMIYTTIARAKAMIHITALLGLTLNPASLEYPEYPEWAGLSIFQLAASIEDRDIQNLGFDFQVHFQLSILSSQIRNRANKMRYLGFIDFSPASNCFICFDKASLRSFSSKTTGEFSA
jgi:hypothetical protein